MAEIIVKYVIILSLVFTPMTICAQSKPKRDVSKDRSVLQHLKEQRVSNSRKNNVSEKIAIRKKNKKRRGVTTQKEASYLLVDHKNALTTKFNSNGDSKRFVVNTDGRSWLLVYVPTWCKITKSSDSFVLYCEPNLNHTERMDWFKIMADNQEVRVNVIQDGLPINISASFPFVYLQHNMQYAAMNCLKISASVSLGGAKDLNCRVMALFYDEKNRLIKAEKYHPSYTFSPDDAVCVYTDIVPVTDSQKIYNVSMYLPNDVMAIDKKGKVRCSLMLYCVKTNDYIKGANYSLEFKVKKKKGRIITYYAR